MQSGYAYYECLGDLSCEERWVNVCQDVCHYSYQEYNQTCYEECADDMNSCECEADQEECNDDCDEGDVGCGAACDATYELCTQ